MRLLLLALTLAAAVPAMAQHASAPYPVSVGEQVRVQIAATGGHIPKGAYLSGRVRSLSADSLELAAGDMLPWSRVASVERRGESRTGEALGMLVGGIVGGLVGYVIGDAATDNSLGKGAALPGAFSGLLVGGVIGAKVAHSWEPVPESRPALGVRVSVPIR